MNRILKPIQTAFILMILAALSSCTLGAFGQAAEPTATAVDVNAVMTSAAATAFVELTKIAGQASPTLAPSKTPATTNMPSTAATTSTPDAAAAATNTSGAAGLPATPTLESGLPPTPTIAVESGGTVVTAIPSLTPLGGPAVPTNSGPTCYNSAFVADISIPDGTVLKPYEKFYKIWRIQNTGTCAWDQGFGFVQWTGPYMGTSTAYFSNRDQPVGPGGIIDIGVEMRAPAQPNDYVAHWSMISDTGKTFGGDFTVAIKVVK
jgi:hypothetical protein